MKRQRDQFLVNLRDRTLKKKYSKRRAEYINLREEDYGEDGPTDGEDDVDEDLLDLLETANRGLRGCIEAKGDGILDLLFDLKKALLDRGYDIHGEFDQVGILRTLKDLTEVEISKSSTLEFYSYVASILAVYADSDVKNSEAIVNMKFADRIAAVMDTTKKYNFSFHQNLFFFTANILANTQVRDYLYLSKYIDKVFDQADISDKNDKRIAVELSRVYCNAIAPDDETHQGVSLTLGTKCVKRSILLAMEYDGYEEVLKEAIWALDYYLCSGPSRRAKIANIVEEKNITNFIKNCFKSSSFDLSDPALRCIRSITYGDSIHILKFFSKNGKTEDQTTRIDRAVLKVSFYPLIHF